MGKKTERPDSEEPAAERPKKRNKPKKVEDPNAPPSKISKRQLKRERHAQRVADAEEASHKAVQMQALSYLSLWKHNRAEWKFNKVKQIWLLKHKFDDSKVPEELWRALVEYFSAGSGSVRSLVVEDCRKIIAETEEKSESGETETTAYRRARSLMQSVPS